MSRWSFVATGVVASSVVFSLAMVSPASAALVSEPVAVDQSSSSFSSSSQRGVGVFYTMGDAVHISSTPPPTASAHGWWERGSAKATRADVTIRLQIKKGNSWVYVGSTGKKRVPPGGGSGNRATTRAKCKNSEMHQWRSVIDVDLVGSSDTSDKGETPAKSLACGA